MKSIRRSARFKKDYKKANLSAGNKQILKSVIHTLACGKQLDKKFRDHPLVGQWKGYRELHLKPDWLLIYKVTDDELRLARLGSHAELFG